MKILKIALFIEGGWNRQIIWNNDKMIYNVKRYKPPLFNQLQMNWFYQMLHLKTELINLEAAPDPNTVSFG